MRIARFAAAGKDPAYGIIELEVDGGENPETIAAITGDPLAGVPVNYTGARHDLSDVRLLAPVIPRSKIVAVGRNYADHAIEQGAVVPAEPMLFLKPNTCVIGPNEPIVRPDGCEDLHYEGELAIIIGRICKQVPEERVADVVFGYTIANDVTATGRGKETSGSGPRAVIPSVLSDPGSIPTLLWQRLVILRSRPGSVTRCFSVGTPPRWSGASLTWSPTSPLSRLCFQGTSFSQALPLGWGRWQTETWCLWRSMDSGCSAIP